MLNEMPHNKLFIPVLLLTACIAVLLILIKTPLASVFYINILAHSFILLGLVVTLFLVAFFAYQYYLKDKEICCYFIFLATYILGVFGFVHAIAVPAFGWGNEALFDISEHYGLFLTSLFLYGLVIPFSAQIQDKIYKARSKIFLGLSFLLITAFALIFFWPTLSQILYSWVNFFIGFTGINFFLLMLVLLIQKRDSFFNSYFPNILALLGSSTIPPFFYKEWNLTWWYVHFLELLAIVILLLLLRAKMGIEKQVLEIPFSSFSIRTRLFFIVGLTVVAITINGLIDFNLSQNHIKTQTLENLVLIADLQEGQVLNWLDQIKDRTIDFSSDGFIATSLEKILHGDKQAVDDLNRHILENKQPIDQAIFGIHIMDLNGKVVASSQGDELGKEDMAMEEVFIQAKASRFATAFLSDIVEDSHFGVKNTAIMATAPLVDQEKNQFAGEEEKRENLGVIMIFFKSNGLSNILTGKAQTELGALSTWTARKKTLEMYLVNKDKVMASESKYIVNASLNQKADILPVRLCEKSEEISGEYLNYQGVSVLGASMCLDNGWTLLAEVNKSEAFAPLGDFLQQNILSASASSLLVLIAVYLFTIGITSPLKELSEAAQKISRGDFTARANIVTSDELGRLSGVFNEMAGNIQTSNASLQQKIKTEEASRLAVTNILGDLEEEKKKVESFARDLEKFKLATESTSDMVVISDPEGIALYANPATEKITGYAAEETIGKKCGLLWGGHMEKAYYQKMWQTIKEDKKPFVSRIKNKRKNGETYDAAIAISPVLDQKGNILFFVDTSRDITKEIEIDKAKTEFVSLASHQLRTPLSTINWYTEMLLSGDAGVVNENQKKYLEEAYHASKRMVDLVNSLLNVSRLEMGTFIVEPEPTDMLVLARSVVDELKLLIDQKKISFKLTHADNLPKIQADPKLLRMVLSNLLSNSVKYTPEKGEVKMDFRLVKSGEEIGNKLIPADSLLCAVSDTGYGIPENQKDKIFTKLFRADNVREKDAEGTGLGLYIVKSIIDHSGGLIWFESSEGKGTTFYVILPLEGMKKKEGTKALA